LFEDCFEVFDDFLSQIVGIGKIIGFFHAVISEQEDFGAGFAAVDATNSCL
jgi:hypothetical protein